MEKGVGRRGSKECEGKMLFPIKGKKKEKDIRGGYLKGKREKRKYNSC